MQHKNHFSPLFDELGNKLVKHVLWGISLIGVAALLCAMANLCETILIIEIATTSCAVLVSVICLAHLYHEHQAFKQQEQRLIKALLQYIEDEFVSLPRPWLIEEILLQALGRQGTQEQRLEMLTQYRHQPAALAAFVEYCRQIDASNAVLMDLGLCWD